MCDWIVKELKLRWNVKKFEYIDENNKTICINPSHRFESPSLILIKKEELVEFIKKNNLTLFWILYGNKNIITKSIKEREPARYDINGIYILKDGNLKGNIELKTIYPKGF